MKCNNYFKFMILSSLVFMLDYNPLKEYRIIPSIAEKYSEYYQIKRLDIARDAGHCENCIDFMMNDDIMIKTLAKEITKDSKSREDSAQRIINFVHENIESGLDSIDADEKEIQYVKFPLETLVENYGDCEDTAILSASLIKSLDIDVVMIYLYSGVGRARGPHITLGIEGNFTGYFYNFNRKRYYHADVGWNIGEMSYIFDNRDYEIYTLE